MARFVAAVCIALALVASVSAYEYRSSVKSARAFQNQHPVWTHAGVAADEDIVSLVFAVRQKNVAQLQELLAQVSDPRSPMYTDYVSLSQVGDMFCDREATAVVQSFLTNAGVEFATTLNGDFITATLTAARAKEVFGATFHRFTAPGASVLDNARATKMILRAQTFTVPDVVAIAVDFVEHTTELPAAQRPQFLVHSPATAGYDGDCTPQTLQKYYNVPSKAVTPASGSSMSVFETDAQSFSPLDLSVFEKNFSLAEDPVSKVVGPNSPTACILNPNNCAEASLDVQYIMSVAQGVPLTYWSIVATDQTPFLDWTLALANDTNAPLVHSISYGTVETDEAQSTADRFNTELMKLGVRGLTVMIASGDDGVANFPARSDPTKCGFFPSFPATSPYATAVGATQGPEAGGPEIACTSATGGLITTGGGFSGYWQQPDWQKDAVAAYMSSGVKIPPLNMFNSTGRAYPDVSMLGHNYVIFILAGPMVGSGTSASTPVFAGLVALANNARLAAGKKPLGFLNPALYQAPESIFHDITSGENNCAAGPTGREDCCEYGFTAAKGWDPVTGRGSADAAKFVAHFESL